MSKIINDMDIGMKALTTAFVKAALETGYNIAQIDRMVREVKEELEEEKLFLNLPTESPDEQEFRKKAVEFAKQNKELGETNEVAEMLCVMYKLFNSPTEQIDRTEIVKMTYERLVERDLNRRYIKAELNNIYIRLKNFRVLSVSFDYCWNNGLYEFLKQYKYRNNSAKRVVLEMVWLVEKQND